MALYLALGRIDEARLEAVRAESLHPGKVSQMRAGAPGWLWVDDDPARFGPALDESTGVTVISSGRTAWSATEWSRAAQLPYAGGLANRLLLQRYLDGGPDAVVPYNGAATIVVHDPRNDQVHVWTDQFGYHPCFLYRGDSAEHCIVTTFPDVLLADPSASLTYDLVSMAEFIRAWRATPPHTYFAEVKHAGAAAHITIDRRAGAIRHETYWAPFTEDFFPSIGEAAEELAAAVQAAIHERTAVAERPLFFVSGGADSRVLLFCAADRSRVTGVNLYERAAAETDVARALCETAGCNFRSLQRDNDFYPRNLPEMVRWSGAMWSAEDTHYPGFADRFADLDPDLIMTACTTDWLFKGYGLEKSYRMLFGRYLPFLKYEDDRVDGFLPNEPLPTAGPMAKIVDDRMAAWFDGCPTRLKTPRDRLMVEDKRVRPAAYAVSVSGQVMYRTFPYDTFLGDSRVAACYSRSHPDWKLNRELWGKVAARLCEGAGQIVDSNFGWRVDASMPEKAVMFAAGWIGRRRAQRGKAPVAGDDDRPPSAGSWPDLGWYARRSKTVERLWMSATPEERDRMRAICQSDPWKTSLSDWAGDGNQLFRMLTLLSHWRECDQRRARSAQRWMAGSASPVPSLPEG
ncbi:MAG: hypothetical protein ABW360_16420 [Phenylobacterium sp.]